MEKTPVYRNPHAHGMLIECSTFDASTGVLSAGIITWAELASRWPGLTWLFVGVPATEYLLAMVTVGTEQITLRQVDRLAELGARPALAGAPRLVLQQLAAEAAQVVALDTVLGSQDGAA